MHKSAKIRDKKISTNGKPSIVAVEKNALPSRANITNHHSIKDCCSLSGVPRANIHYS